MSEHVKAVVAEPETHRLSMGKYVIGFGLSVAVTVIAYVIAVHGSWSHDVIIGVLASLAIMQFLVQMVFFLHIGEERKPRWKQGVMWFMIGIVLLIVFGSIWIMNNLNYRMTTTQTEHYLQEQDGGI